MDTNTTKKERLIRANRIKAAKAARSVPTSILLQKKAECDAKALKIVQRLIEPNVEVEWLLGSLGHINRIHMEDVAEERAIEKICGYVLCNNPLTKVVNKKYQISTLRNKVYDVEKVKNFCSYSCYAAMDHVMMQMLTSPLWLRNKEEIPVFDILPRTKQRTKSPPGVEINIMGLDLPDDTDEIPLSRKDTDENKDELKKDTDPILDNLCQTQHGDSSPISFSSQAEAYITSNFEKIQISSEEADQVVSFNQEVDDISHPHLSDSFPSPEVSTDIAKQNSDVVSLQSKYLASQLNEDRSQVRKRSSPICNNETVKIPRKHDIAKKVEYNTKPVTSYETLTTRIERSFSEWITEETMSLLHGNDIEKQKIIDNVTLQDKYMVLCRKLNRIQLKEEKDDNSTAIQLENLKPPPDYSVLKEDSEKLELKVRAFYQGKSCIEIPDKDGNETEQVEETPNVVPLTDAHDPRALRRRIFLDKLNKVLPDLLHALIGPSHSHCTYEADKIMSVKILIATFGLSATNIIFRTAEWTLVGLIIIKMLGIIDPAIKSLLLTKKATMYISMILMAYKLDSTYLDYLINSRINPPKINTDSSDEGD